MKTRLNDTTENKFQLLNFDAGINYNFAADSLGFSELFTSFRTNIGSFLNISGSANFNLYKYDELSNSRLNQYLISSDGKLADLTNFNFSMSTSFNFGLSNRDNSLNKDTIVLYDSLKGRGQYKDVRK
ncbi:MAG: hypothetical protein IPJ45_02510 [Ignavibacteria bacterium]|nr:hypothetical protein [Ignavibacteria bacterium]